MLSDKELYEGFPEEAKKYRAEVTVRHSEDALRKLS